MLKKIYHKKNELFEVEFYQDKECTKPFDFTNAKNLYIDGLNRDITPLMFLYGKIENCNLCIPFLPNTKQNEVYSLLNSVLHARGIKLYTLSSVGDVTNRNACIDNTSIFSITTNLSKYIPEDNAVLFLSEEDCKKYSPIKKYNYNQKGHFSNPENVNDVWLTTFDAEYNTLIAKVGIGLYDVDDDCLYRRCPESGNRIYFKKITIFLPHGTQSEIQKANEVAKELKEKYGVEVVNLFVLHCFVVNVSVPCKEFVKDVKSGRINEKSLPIHILININKIITTNSTGILKPKDSKERLQVIDCFDIFQDHLNNI